ncbi:sulfatase [Actinoplanes sp. NPDC051343]|jgi:arylsulfatase A-like enzyme|uniref:sulfatase n=1 Tax=Actinoplanes sp. NPDC051343 TaxID=3363906 RepID=UPI0037930C9F
MIRRLIAVTAAVSLVAGCSHSGAGSATEPTKTNIVMVLTDDLSMNLVPYMPHVLALEKQGTTFADYTVTDSLCCPSRSSIFSGRFPHDTGIYTNGGRDGGFQTFKSRGEESSTFATDLQRAGYRTAMMGKYLNGYAPNDKYVPPGWTEWDVAGNGYPEYNYNLLQNGQIQHYGHDYLTDVVSGKASDFISTSAKAGKPFMVEVATFAPHAPYTPADPDKDKFPGLKAPRTAAYDVLPTDPPPWLADRQPLTSTEQTAIDTAFRKRVQAVQAVDRMIGSLEDTLDKAGVADRTMVVFTSDNGYHMGEHRLNPGKQTAFDTDIHVPLVMAGPGVAKGATISRPAENIDLRPTYDALAGTATPADVDGQSLLPLLGDHPPASWRTAALIEHHGPDNDATDPDHPAPNSGNPTSYEAIRTEGYTYVEYTDGAKEYYDHRADPDQLHNTAEQLPPDQLTSLHKTLLALEGCHHAC